MRCTSPRMCFSIPSPISLNKYTSHKLYTPVTNCIWVTSYATHLAEKAFFHLLAVFVEDGHDELRWGRVRHWFRLEKWFRFGKWFRSEKWSGFRVCGHNELRWEWFRSKQWFRSENWFRSEAWFGFKNFLEFRVYGHNEVRWGWMRHYIHDSWHVCERVVSYRSKVMGRLDTGVRDMEGDESCHTYEWVIISESWHSCEWVEEHISIRHGTFKNEAWYLAAKSWVDGTQGSMTWKNKSWHIYKWVMAYL